MGTPKTLGFLVILGLQSGIAAVAALKRRGGRKRGDFSMMRIRLARFALPRLGLKRKQKRRILFTLGMSCPRAHRKRQSERSPARSGIYRTKRSSSG